MNGLKFYGHISTQMTIDNQMPATPTPSFFALHLTHILTILDLETIHTSENPMQRFQHSQSHQKEHGMPIPLQ